MSIDVKLDFKEGTSSFRERRKAVFKGA